MASLTGKTALVTGATSGIGFGIARHFLSLGASVVIHGRDRTEAAGAATELSTDRGACTGVSADLRDVAACRAMMRAAIAWKGGLDVLVNNAGMTDRGYLEDAPVELWDDIMAVNLRAPFLCLQEAVVSMKTRGGGSIVNIGSVNAYIGAPKLGPYSVSKGGLMTLTRNAAAALNRYRIRVNQLNVGWTLTEGEDAVQKRQGTRADWLRDASAIMPFGRLLTPHEIALAAAYFASDDSALITGGVLDMEQYPLGAPADW
jgi:NAD(P)-dependent dehydrogenase (short-subunit alcohol dehydrogenase family)